MDAQRRRYERRLVCALTSSAHFNRLVDVDGRDVELHADLKSGRRGL
jgi:hypothetical protein